jgi:hypothetical protein
LSSEFAIGTIHDGPLPALVSRYFEDGYGAFDQLCRSVYAEVLPVWDSEFVPWDEIVVERSRTWRAIDATQAESPVLPCTAVAQASDIAEKTTQQISCTTG